MPLKVGPQDSARSTICLSWGHDKISTKTENKYLEDLVAICPYSDIKVPNHYTNLIEQDIE